MVLAGKSRSVLEMLLTMEDKSSKELKKVDSNLGKVDKAAKKSSQGVKGINTQLLGMGVAVGGAIAGTAALVKGLYELGGRGAAVQQTTESYDGLLRKLDVAPDLIEKQRAAVRGTVDDMTLMAATQTLLAGTTDEVGKELAEATPKLLEIAKAANKLNPTLGDTAFLYESIATGIKRGSPLILDNLGLTIKLGEANERYAKSLGITVEELSSEQKTLALLNEVTEESGRLLLEQAGGVDSVTDAYAANQVMLKNLSDELAMKAAPAIGRVIERVNELLPPLLDWLEVHPGLQQALDDNIITLDEYEGLLAMFAGTTEQATDAQDYLDRAIARNNLQLQIAADRTGWAAGQNREYIETLEDEAVAVDKVAEGMKKFSAQLLFQQIQDQLDPDVALEVGLALGVIDDKTLLLNAALPGLIDHFDSTEDGMIDGAEAGQGFTDSLIDLFNAIDALPDYKRIEIEVDQTGDGIPAGISGDFGKKGKKGYGFGQHGLDMVVPQGFREPNNPFWVGASSGEEVSVTPRGQQKDRDNVIININNPQINSEIDVDNMARQVAEVIREKGK
jgi:hypothetical protein